MKYASAIYGILKMNEESIYENCRNSLLHKIIQDASFSSTSTWRYRHPDFYWSVEAVKLLAGFAKVPIAGPLPDQLQLTLPDQKEARSRLRQEHVVPTGLVIKHLLENPKLSINEIFEILNCARIVCVVTRDEDKRLDKTKMPEEKDFLESQWARYDHPKTGNKIEVSPYSCAEWFGKGASVTFKPRLVFSA